MSASLNGLLEIARWMEGGKIVGLDNNVHLAQALERVRGQRTSTSHIQAIRNGTTTDPRWSILWAVCEVLTEKTGVEVTADYFYDSTVQDRVNDALATRLELLREQL